MILTDVLSRPSHDEQMGGLSVNVTNTKMGEMKEEARRDEDGDTKVAREETIRCSPSLVNIGPSLMTYQWRIES